MRAGFRDLAIFTIVQDEPEFIHPWINHYKKHVVAPQDIYILIHAPSAGGVTPAWEVAEKLMADHHCVRMVPVHNESSFDHRWLAATVSKFQSFLLQSYRWALFAECDEFILPTPGPTCTDTMLGFIASLDPDPPSAVRATGFEVLQQEGDVPLAAELYQDGKNFTLTAGLMMECCKHWYPSKDYSKTLLANTPIQWDIGFHSPSASADETVQAIATAPASPALMLVHLHRVDFALALTRVQRSRARRWSKADIQEKLGWQNRIEREDKLRRVWNRDYGTNQPMPSGQLREILPDVKKALR